MTSRNIVILCMMCGCLIAAPASAELVANGGFSAGTHSVGDPVDDGWTNPGDVVVLDSLFAISPDTFDASFPDTGALSQTLGTVAGTDYTLSFSVLDDSPAFSDTFTVSLGGFTPTAVGGFDASSYTPETFTVPGSDLLGNDILSFSASSSSGNWHLEDVSVTAVVAPEPASMTILLTALGLTSLTSLRGCKPGRRG